MAVAFLKRPNAAAYEYFGDSVSVDGDGHFPGTIGLQQTDPYTNWASEEPSFNVTVAFVCRRYPPAWAASPRRLFTYLWRNRHHVKTSVKLLVSFFQIATKVPTVYQVRMPAPVQTVSNIFGFASLDLDSLGLPWRCLGVGTFYTRLLAMVVGPPALLLVVFLASVTLTARARHRNRASEKERGSFVNATFLRALPALGLISFLAFPVVSSYAFRAFDCACFDDGRSYLRADYSLLCSTGCVMPSRPMLFETNHTGVYTDEYWEVQYLARVAIAAYPVAIPLINLVLLLAARKALSTEQTTKLSTALGFLRCLRLRATRRPRARGAASASPSGRARGCC